MASRAENYRTSKVAKRDPRYDIADLRCCCFIRNINMRAATFEMNVIDISHDGASICDSSLNCIAYKAGDILTATIDVNRRIFSRPINIRYRVVHSLVEGNNKNYGLVLIEVNDFHLKAYEQGLSSLTPDRETEISLFHHNGAKISNNETPPLTTRKLSLVHR